MNDPETHSDTDDTHDSDAAAVNAPPTFFELGLSKPTLAAMALSGFGRPTAIQMAAIPAGRAGRDLIGVAATGTGKTLAFGIPLVERLSAGVARRALVLAPTRELATQIADHLLGVAKAHEMGVALLIGGARTGPQRAAMEGGTRIWVGTPGRLRDLLRNDPALAGEVDVLVLDEADRLLDMGFEEQVLEVIGLLPETRQTMLFSATFPPQVEAVAARALKDPSRFEVDRSGTVARGALQRVIQVTPIEKLAVLLWLLSSLRGKTLVFVRTQQKAARYRTFLRRARHRVECLHGGLTPAQRKESLERLNKGKVRILVATNLAARGLDLSAIEHVINVDVPEAPEDYIHRVGRTARMEREGVATTLAEAEEIPRLRRIEMLTGVPVQIVAGPDEMEPWIDRARSLGKAKTGFSESKAHAERAKKGASGKLKRRLKTKAKAKARRRRAGDG